MAAIFRRPVKAAGREVTNRDHNRAGPLRITFQKVLSCGSARPSIARIGAASPGIGKEPKR